jgi:protein-L-isoaspartate(D-aspartate) O-methyltransferase
MLMTDPVLAARRSYADELRFTTGMRSPALHAAFATVPRERFVGTGPWRIKSPWNLDEYWTTEDADPRHVYHDTLIALDEKIGLNNGQPGLWAYLFDRVGVTDGEQVLHLGCGTGYYTAILAEMVGPTGKVTAIEIHAELAAHARQALGPWARVDVSHADGASAVLEPADFIVASAGATHPLPAWLAALKLGGRLLFPLTTTHGGAMLLITRQAEEEFPARFLCRVAFYEFSGARDPGTNDRLAAAFGRDHGASLKTVRRDAHDEDETCWLHGQGWCLSRRDLVAAEASS